MFVGNPASSSVIDRFVADRSATISTTSTNHKFSAASRPSAGSVVLTVQRTRTTLGVPATVTVFTATSSSTDTILNGYYPMTISPVTNGDLLENDVLEVVVQAGAVNASFATIVYTISAVA
jgi:L-cystine uptake protein TcyP (sodium:dicarboxylate symporter family)